MNGSQCGVPAKAAEQSYVSVWRSAGFSAPRRFVTSEGSEPIGHLGAVGAD